MQLIAGHSQHIVSSFSQHLNWKSRSVFKTLLSEYLISRGIFSRGIPITARQDIRTSLSSSILHLTESHLRTSMAFHLIKNPKACHLPSISLHTASHLIVPQHHTARNISRQDIRIISSHSFPASHVNRHLTPSPLHFITCVSISLTLYLASSASH